MADKNTLNINQYRKFSWDEIKDDVIKLIDPQFISRSSLQEYFSNQSEKQSDGTYKVIPSKYRVTDYFDLPANIINNPTIVKDTTFGLFLFNAFVLNNAFKGKIGYVNLPLNDDNMGTLIGKISDGLMSGIFTVEEFAEFTNTIVWLGYQTELFMPGVSLNLCIPNKNVAKLKVELLKAHPEYCKGNRVDTSVAANYSVDIEKPLIAKAKEELKDDPAMRLYDLGKPSFGNNYKNSLVTNGPLFDPVSGQYKININSYVDGINSNNFDTIANKAMTASYSRSVNTAVGGTYAKYMSAMMQNVSCGPKDSDCGTTGYYNFPVTKDNWKVIKYNYALINGKLTRLEPELLKTLIGKTIKMRSPLYCKDKKCICNKCIGDQYYILGIKHIGLTAGIAPNASMNKSMKAMHDISIKTVEIKPEEFFVFYK